MYYSQQLSKKVSLIIGSTLRSSNRVSTQSYAPLSEVVQRAQEQPNLVSNDEWRQLHSAIGTRVVKELLAGKSESWKPEFQSISEKLEKVSKSEEQAKKSELKTPREEISGSQPGDGKKAIAINNTNTKCVQRTIDEIPEFPYVNAKVEEYNQNENTPDKDYGKLIIDLEEILESIKKEIITQKTIIAVNNLKRSIKQEKRLLQKKGFEKAKDEHKEDRKVLYDLIEAGAKEDEVDIRLRNSQEWIKKGWAGTKLYALTLTGDSYARVIKAKKNPDQEEAFFPTVGFQSPGDIYSAPVWYNENDLFAKKM